jgi:hypothetical protein
MSNYLISISNSEALNDGTIHDTKSKLKVKAFNLVKSAYSPKKDEVQFFVTAGQHKLAFETQGYKKHRELLVLHMISYYCVYLGLLEARIHPSWP